jgi:WD40 repeat protein
VLVRVSRERLIQEQQRLKELSQKYLAGRLAEEAELARQESPRLLPRSMLLAIEAMSRWPSPQAHQALRRGLSLLPRPVNRLQHRSTVKRIAFSPKGQWLASGSQDGVIQIWDAHTLVRVAEVKHDARVNGLAFSPDERWIAAASDDKTAPVWEVETRRLVASLPHDEPVRTVEFFPDGTLLLTATGFRGHPGLVQLWNVARWKKTGSADHMIAAKFHPRGEVVVSAAGDQVLVWQAATGNGSGFPLHDGAVLAVDHHPQYALIAATTFNESLWVLGKMQSQGDPGVHDVHEKLADSISRVSPVVFSPDGRWLAAVGVDFTVRVWEVDTLKEIRQMAGLGEELGIDLVFDPSGQLLASVWLEHQSIWIWNIYTGQTVACIEQDQASAVCFSPDRQRMASASDRDAAWIWELPAAGGVIWTVVVGLGKTLTFSSDGRWLAWTGTRVGQDGAIIIGETSAMLKVLEAATGHEVWSFQHDAPVETVAFSPDGQWIASACGDAVRVWEVAIGREEPEMRQEAQEWLGEVIQMAQEHPQAAISSDGKWLATRSGGDAERPYRLGQRRVGAIQIQEVSTGRMVSELRFGGDTTAMAFSPDGRYLASGHADGIIRLWETRNGHELARLEHHIASVTGLAFSCQGNWLASASYDQSVRLWLVRPDDLVNEACSRLTRNLTLEEWQHYIGDDEPYRKTCPELPGPEEEKIAGMSGSTSP